MAIASVLGIDAISIVKEKTAIFEFWKKCRGGEIFEFFQISILYVPLARFPPRPT